MPLVHVLSARRARQRPTRLSRLPCSIITLTGVKTGVYGPGVRSHTGSEQQAWEVGWYDIFDSFPHERVDKKLEKKLHVQEVFY